MIRIALMFDQPHIMTWALQHDSLMDDWSNIFCVPSASFSNLPSAKGQRPPMACQCFPAKKTNQKKKKT